MECNRKNNNLFIYFYIHFAKFHYTDLFTDANFNCVSDDFENEIILNILQIPSFTAKNTYCQKYSAKRTVVIIYSETFHHQFVFYLFLNKVIHG